MMRLLVAVLLLSGCGGVTAENSGDGAENPDEGATIVMNWERVVGPYSRLFRSSTTDDDLVCAINARGEAFILNSETGGDEFPSFIMFDVGGVVTGGAGCGNGVIAAVREDGLLRVHDFSGDALWEAALQTRVTSPPLVSDGSVVVMGHDGRISAYSARLGELLWRYVSPLKNLLRTPLDSSPVSSGSVIYAGIDNGVIVALRRDNGRVSWNKRIASARSSHSFANILDVTTPVIRGNVVCAAAYQGHVGCMNTNRGTILWRMPFSSATRVAIGDSRLFAADLDGNISAFSLKDGELLWNKELGDATSVAMTDGALFVGLNSGLLTVSPETGDTLTSINTNGGVTYLSPFGENEVLGSTISGGVFRASFINKTN